MAKSQITLFPCPECGGTGKVPINRWDYEKCEKCNGKGKVSSVPYRNYAVDSSLQNHGN